MAFINEYISAEDYEKYGIAAIDLKYVVGGCNSLDWTVDKGRNIYLRQVANGPHEPELFGKQTWTLFWEGELVEVGLDLIDSKGRRGAPCWAHIQVRYINLPPHLEQRRPEVVECLREALLAYKDGGVYSASTEFSLTLGVRTVRP